MSLVLRHAAQDPQLSANAGNIALLRICGELGLIDATLGLAVGDAYRAMRRLQHQLRLQGRDNAGLDPDKVEQHSVPVRTLWAAIFAATTG